MEILLLTVFLSLLLAGLFFLMFLRDRQEDGISSLDQESLRPFAAEEPVEASRK
ncbi:MAG: hypothetical protein AAFX93_10725 [Verrucomicrobiota bacterium]